MTAADARRLLDAANEAGVVHAVTFNYRGNPLVQQAREMIAGGELGAVHFIHGAYLQDWLLEADRLLVASRAREGRRKLRGRRYRIALVRSGAARHRPANRRSAGRFDDGGRHAAEAGGLDRGVRAKRRRGARGRARSAARIWRRILVRFDGGAKGTRVGRAGLRRPQERSLVRGQRAAGVAALGAGAAERAVDRPPRRARTPCCRRIRRCSAAGARAYAHLPGGHQEGVGRRVLQRDARRLRLHRRRQAIRTIRGRRPSPPSKTDIIRRASSTRCWRATARGAACGRRCTAFAPARRPLR